LQGPKRFNFQVLLESFKEEFNLPTGFVDPDNGVSSKFEIVNQKKILFTQFLRR